MTKAKKSGKRQRMTKAKKKGKGHKVVPEIGGLMNTAFPMWEVDAGGNRVTTKPCTVDSCEWNPHYVTKRYAGRHPDLGGHPTDLDVQYPFYGGAPFGGQPYQGTPHHCSRCAPDDIKAKDCPKIETMEDTGPSGPGHVPPHISLAALTWCVAECFPKCMPFLLWILDSYQARNSCPCCYVPVARVASATGAYKADQGQREMAAAGISWSNCSITTFTNVASSPMFCLK